MDNKKIISDRLGYRGYEIGCYTELINELSIRSINRITRYVDYLQDTKVSINKKIYVVQIDKVDNDIDFVMITKEEYISRYCFDLAEFRDKF